MSIPKRLVFKWQRLWYLGILIYKSNLITVHVAFVSVTLFSIQLHYIVLNYFIDTQTSKELIQMDINNMMTNGIFTMNDKHTVRTRTQHNTESYNHGWNLL